MAPSVKTITAVLSLLVASFFCQCDAAALLPRDISPYAPTKTSCPAKSLVRKGDSLSKSEADYVRPRALAAKGALACWLDSLNGSFRAHADELPIIALSTSGGGLRSLLTGAGVVQAFDARDSNATVKGLFQSLTYHAALSGGAWMVSSFMGNNWPTVSSLRDNLWGPAFQKGLLPTDQPQELAEIVADLVAKNAAGYPPTVVDIYGRALSYELLQGPDGGVNTTLSSITTQPNFQAHNVAYPILTALEANIPPGTCIPASNAKQYELTPYEFGSWDAGIDAFTPTKYLGSSVSNGKSSGQCTVGYDNLGYVLGTSSDVFNQVCSISNLGAFNSTSITAAAQLLAKIHNVTDNDLFAKYPNPFSADSATPYVSNTTELDLVDGGESHQNNPIWPFLQPERQHVDVLLVNDNSADVNNYPNGSELYMTYTQAQTAGLHRMPTIPTADVFVARGYNVRPTFFGCNDAKTLTLIYLPNTNYTYSSNQDTYKLQYSQAETNAMIANGFQVATKGNDPAWPTCLACGLLRKKSSRLPRACADCLKQYCYN